MGADTDTNGADLLGRLNLTSEEAEVTVFNGAEVEDVEVVAE